VKVEVIDIIDRQCGEVLSKTRNVIKEKVRRVEEAKGRHN
jgi:hypothetical protein